MPGPASPPPESAQSRATTAVGVVMPARDAERWVGTALRSLQDQTLTDWVCVVVDDGSSDGTAEVVRSLAADDGRLHLVRESGVGVAAARNAGLAALPGCAYVGFLDSDDLYLPDALEVLTRALAARPDAVAAYGLAEYVDEHGQELNPGLHPQRQRWRRTVRDGRLVVQPPEADATFDSLVVDDPVWPAAVALHRTDEVRRAGGFDPSFPVLEDWELHLRLARRGPYVAVDEQVALYRRHGSNLTSGHDEAEYQRERVRRTAWLAEGAEPGHQAAVVAAWRLLERRQVLVLGRHVLRSLGRRRWRSAGRAAAGVVVTLVGSARPGPPPASRRRTRITRPSDRLDVPL